MQKQLTEAVTFFRNEPGFSRLFLLMKQKYESIGRMRGTVKIADFTEAEREAIGEFLGKDAAISSVSLEKFEKQFEKTRFAGIQLAQLLEHFFGEELSTKKERKQQEMEEKNRLLEQLCGRFPAQAEWIRESRFLQQLYSQSNFSQIVENVCLALQSLPKQGEYERLPLFAQRIVRDPHGFDANTVQGKLLLNALRHFYGTCENGTTAEEVNELLQSAGILRDDILNFVTCTGIRSEHPVWEQAVATNTVLNVPLREVMKLKQAAPVYGKNVFVVENSGVFSALLDLFDEQYPPLICTHGQFKLASLLLIDRLIENGYTIYYAGDFDPEGLQMAQRLKQRSPRSVRLWLYGVPEYRLALSEVDLEEERLRRLQSITIPELLPVAEEMKVVKKAGYQEELVALLFQVMKSV
ncbi:MAG: TIGR02679 family protein [Ectobacillus sp.]